MKKIISAILSASLFVMMLTSCVSGVSVPYYNLAMDNYSDNVFEQYDAVTETIVYYDNDEESYRYSIYMEKSLENAYSYNICESFAGYTFYGYEGDLYSISGDKTYAVIQADKSTYLEYINDYQQREHIIDQGEKYQIYSKELENDMKEVSYYTKMTPVIVADLYKYGIKETDKIISTYTLSKDNFYLEIVYSVKHSDGTEEKLAKRTFEYFQEKQSSVFEALPNTDKSVNVTIVFHAGNVNETKDVYVIPMGVYIGIDQGDNNVSFYMDSDYQVAFDYETALADNDITIYAKNN